MDSQHETASSKASISGGLFEVARHFPEPVEYISGKFSGKLCSGQTTIDLFFGGDFGHGPEEGDRLGEWIADALNAALTVIPESLDGLSEGEKAVLLDYLQSKERLTAHERLMRQGIIFHHRGCHHPSPSNDKMEQPAP